MLEIYEGINTESNEKEKIFKIDEKMYITDVLDVENDKYKNIFSNNKFEIDTDIKGIYIHFKGNEYEVMGKAYSFQDNQYYVVYKSLYETENIKFGTVWCRPYDMFFGPVDKVKYPHVEQKERFLKISK